MRTSLLVPMLLAAATLSSEEASAWSSLRAHLTGAEMAPPVTSPATGHVVFTPSKDGSVLLYKLVVANVENVSSAKLLFGNKESNGAAIATLYPMPGKARVEGKFSGALADGSFGPSGMAGSLAGQPIAELIRQIAAGNVYVLVATRAHPDGEIRGLVQ